MLNEKAHFLLKRIRSFNSATTQNSLKLQPMDSMPTLLLIEKEHLFPGFKFRAKLQLRPKQFLFHGLGLVHLKTLMFQGVWFNLTVRTSINQSMHFSVNHFPKVPDGEWPLINIALLVKYALESTERSTWENFMSIQLRT